jgi:hypothetical protein
MSPTNWDRPIGSPQLHAGAIYSRVTWALEKLEEWGVNVSPTCRARNALRLLQTLHEANARGEPASVRTDPATFAAQHHTATELFFIVYAATLCDYPDHPFTKQKFETVVRGSDGVEGRHTDPRNKEFELTVAARLRLGGIKVYDGEPDLQMEIGSERWGVAVKRITSQSGKQLKTRLQDAVQQIERTSLPGIVALKLEGRLTGVPADADDPRWFQEVDAALDEVLKYSEQYLQSYFVRGLLLYSDHTRSIGKNSLNQRPVLDTSGAWRFSRFYFPWEDQLAYEAFWADWQNRVQRHLKHCLGGAESVQGGVGS